MPSFYTVSLQRIAVEIRFSRLLLTDPTVRPQPFAHRHLNCLSTMSTQGNFWETRKILPHVKDIIGPTLHHGIAFHNAYRCSVLQSQDARGCLLHHGMVVIQ